MIKVFLEVQNDIVMKRPEEVTAVDAISDTIYVPFGKLIKNSVIYSHICF